MKLLTQTNGIKIAFFASFLLLSGLNLSAQYKLEKIWERQPMGFAIDLASITKSDDDNLIYVASLNRVITIRTLDGETLKNDTVETAYNLLLSRKGDKLIAAGGEGVGILDPNNFKRVYWDSVNFSDYRSITYNEKQNKFLICGSSLNQPLYSFIRVYDANTKNLYKEFKPDYFIPNNVRTKKASITDDGKLIVYGYETYTTNPDQTSTTHYFLKMIDLNGKLIKNFGETSSTNFITTVDGKILIYFDNQSIHFYDLELMKEVEGIPIGGANPEHIEMSSDGNFMIAGYGGGLVYYDLKTKKSFYLYEGGTWSYFKLNKDNSKVYLGIGYKLYGFNMIPTTSIDYQRNNFEFTIQVNGKKLILSNPQNHQINTLTAYDILGRTYPLSANGNEADISALAAGKYFLKVGLADGSFLDFGFVVE